MRNRKIDAFIGALQSRGFPGSFNPWWEHDPQNDAQSNAADLRRENLYQYLKQRTSTAEILVVAEALGYRGGKFTGIPLTSERLLIGEGTQDEPPFSLYGLQEFQRTSSPALISQGFFEQTATVVFESIKQSPVDPSKFCSWNIFPFHPFDQTEGRLSNRTPSREELQFGLNILEMLLDLFRPQIIIAVGNLSYSYSSTIFENVYKVRHPARGGINLFRQQFASVLTSYNSRIELS